MPVQSPPPPPPPQSIEPTPEPSVVTPSVVASSVVSSSVVTPFAEPFHPSVPAAPTATSAPQSPELPKQNKEFRAPLPWTPPGQAPFPRRAPKSRRRRRLMSANAQDLTLPVEQHEGALESSASAGQLSAKAGAKEMRDATGSSAAKADSKKTVFYNPKDTDSESTTLRANSLASETLKESDRSATSVSNVGSPKANAPETPRKVQGPRRAPLTFLPLVLLFLLLRSSPLSPKAVLRRPSPPASSAEELKQPAAQKTKSVEATEAVDATAVEQEKNDAQPAAPVKAAPKKWSGLFSAAPVGASKAQPNANGPVAPAATNGAATNGDGAVNGGASSFSAGNTNSLAAAIQDFRVGNSAKVQFIEPRGLINTGNMCYMNSVLQVLLFCAPFYNFLDQVSKRAVHKFKSDTPVIDAMIMFMREFRVIDATDTVENLRRKLKSEQLEQYGESFIPEFVYKAIQPLPAFASMRRGHQQDAQEFLGLILNAIDEECAQVMSAGGVTNGSAETRPTSSAASVVESNDGADGWFEVGSRQRAVETRSSGASSTTPITRLFSGQYRSELRRPGVKDSVTTEPFQSLQLDIGAPYIHNVVDAIKGLTTLIETLPPILILHLKRFKFDTEGTTKIGKKVGYPLDLQLPAEVLSKRRRNALVAEGAAMPKYRLIGVVYHHGKQANGGHYTVDVRRQDDNEWIRLDDTVIRRVRSEDVAEAGAEEDAKEAGRSGPASRDASTNRFGAMVDEDEGDGWKEVTTSAKGGDKSGEKKWSAGKPAKDNIKDNKVAYLLFYQRI
ncbi:LOW QUALITY PROTEIN: ubiquitin thiolesterase [Colletotrichum tofieldiae]|nr:LOW QUALITY PROTEIN: ubiquitin thiolesterase [Colletotrichum tofieldiae]